MKLKKLDRKAKRNLEEGALEKLAKVIEKLTSEQCIENIARNILNARLFGKRKSKVYETIQGLMYPIQFSKEYKKFYNEERNYIGDPQCIRKYWVQTSESNEDPESEHIVDKYTYQYSNIVIRNCFSEMIEFLLDEDVEIKNDVYLREIMKIVLEYALFTKSYWWAYDTNEKHKEITKLKNGTFIESEEVIYFQKERKFFRLDFFLFARNKTIAELMNVPLNMVSSNTICEEYQYNKNEDELNKEKAFVIAKTMCKNILDEISFNDAINTLLINKKIFELDMDIEDFISPSFIS